MPYNKAIEKRIDPLIGAWPNIEKKKMFGQLKGSELNNQQNL